MIYGVGIDIVYIPRILKIIQRYGKRFLHRVYTQKEIAISDRYDSNHIKANYFATRFAAKEALVKALGTGFTNNITMKNIEICNEENGKPYILIKSQTLKNYIIHLSISDNKDYATAFVILETK